MRGLLLEAGRVAVREAAERGATEAEAYVSYSRRMNLELTKGIESFRSAESTWVSVRLSLGRRTAIYAATDLSGESIAGAVRRAIAIARASSEDVHWKGFARGLSATTVEGIYDEKTAEMSPEELVEMSDVIPSAVAEAVPKARLVNASLSVGEGHVAIVNSYGEEIFGSGTTAYAWSYAKVEEAGEQSTGSYYQLKRSFRDLDLEDVGRISAERALKFLKARPIETASMDVILLNRVAADILGIMLSGPISASWVQEGRSPLAGKLGEEVSSEEVTVIDDGTLPGGLGSRGFDDEGVPTRVNGVISKGVLKTYLYDNYTARREGRESTGNARRAPWSKPEPAPNNLMLSPGDYTYEEMIQETRRGLLVVDTIGAWLSNPVSGQLNATVTQGMLIEDGEEAAPVKGVIISGDFWDMIRESVAAVGRDVDHSFSNYSPTIKLKDVTVAGK